MHIRRSQNAREPDNCASVNALEMVINASRCPMVVFECARKLRQLVQKQHAAMREYDVAGAEPAPGRGGAIISPFQALSFNRPPICSGL